jgi:hypothetical protein
MTPSLHISEGCYFLSHKIPDEYDPDKFLMFEWEDLEHMKECAQHLLDTYGGNKIRIMHNDNGKLRIAATVLARNKNTIQN